MRTIIVVAAAFFWAPSIACSPAHAQSRTTYHLPGVEIIGGVGDDALWGQIRAQLPIAITPQRAFFFGVDASVGGLDVSGATSTTYDIGAYGVLRQRFDDTVLGGWAGLDVFQSNYGNTFYRAIAGAELFSPRLIARVNGFVPIQDSYNLPSVVTTLSGVSVSTNTIVVDTGPGTSDTVSTTTTTTTTTTITDFYREFAPAGIDAEIGLRHRFVGASLPLGLDEARLFGGGYRYFGLRDDGGDVSGVRGRIELDSYPFERRPDIRLTTSYEVSDDNYSRTVGTFGIRMAVPFGGGEGHDLYRQLGSIKDDPALSQAPSGAGPQGSQDLLQPVVRNTSTLTARRNVGSSTQVSSASTSSATRTPNPISDRNLLCGGLSATLPLRDSSGNIINVEIPADILNDPPLVFTGAPFGPQSTTLAALNIDLNLVAALSRVPSLASITTPVIVPATLSYGGRVRSNGARLDFVVNVIGITVSSAGCRPTAEVITLQP